MTSHEALIKQLKSRCDADLLGLIADVIQSAPTHAVVEYDDKDVPISVDDDCRETLLSLAESIRVKL